MPTYYNRRTQLIFQRSGRKNRDWEACKSTRKFKIETFEMRVHLPNIRNYSSYFYWCVEFYHPNASIGNESNLGLEKLTFPKTTFSCALEKKKTLSKSCPRKSAIIFLMSVRSKFHHQLSITFFSHNCSRRQPAVTTAATKPHHSVGPLGRLGRATLEKAGAGQSTWNDSELWAYAPPLRFFGPSCDHNFRNARNTSDPHYAEVVPSVSLRSCVGCYSIYLLIVSPSILVPCPTGVGNMFQVVDFLFHLAVNHEVVPEFDGVGVPWFCGKGRAVFHCGWSGIHIWCIYLGKIYSIEI